MTVVLTWQAATAVAIAGILLVLAGMLIGGAYEHWRRGGVRDLAVDRDRLCRYLGRDALERQRLADLLAGAEQRETLRERAYSATCRELARVREGAR